ncbi:MAG TPA: helix-turn-helix transcriptional regulator [Pseudonocardiaceae bacterium]|nr:helix-turn-helix transcriptional regulator [Pseudonocardiaceae bacterium]
MAATTSAAGTPRARALSASLRKARLASGIGLRELGRMLSISHTDLSLWENGHRVPNVEVVAMILAALRTVPEERERILDLARSAREPNWLAVGMPGLTQQLAGAMESERAASVITEWSPSLIPGLLQDPDYARVVVSRNPDDIERRMLVRVGRREVITSNDPTRFNALIGEAALRDPVVPPNLMAEQLENLVRLAERPNIDVWVVPSRIGYHPGLIGPFVLYDFPDSPSMVHFEHFSSGAFVPNADNVSDYRSAISVLKGLAVGPEWSPAFIGKIAEEWRGKS